MIVGDVIDGSTEEEPCKWLLAPVERPVSEVIGPLPKIAPKKPAWRLRCGKVVCGVAEDRFSIGAYCPPVSVVMGYVIDIGESVWQLRN
jgi:hypothetical protein